VPSNVLIDFAFVSASSEIIDNEKKTHRSQMQRLFFEVIRKATASRLNPQNEHEKSSDSGEGPGVGSTVLHISFPFWRIPRRAI